MLGSCNGMSVSIQVLASARRLTFVTRVARGRDGDHVDLVVHRARLLMRSSEKVGMARASLLLERDYSGVEPRLVRCNGLRAREWFRSERARPMSYPNFARTYLLIASKVLIPI